MTFEDFMRHVADDTAPDAALPETLRALWYAAKGNWDTAHTIAQGIPSKSGSWIHANLHREEGDLGNAGYWYNRAEKPMPDSSIGTERDMLIRMFLGE